MGSLTITIILIRCTYNLLIVHDALVSVYLRNAASEDATTFRTPSTTPTFTSHPV